MPTASWAVAHDHGGALSFVPRDWDHCEGLLSIIGGELRYTTRQSSHNFRERLAQIEEVKTNRVALRGSRAFHLKLPDGRNYNFIPMRASAAGIVDAILGAR